jgi:DNA-binding IclR family transcriptional regulator
MGQAPDTGHVKSARRTLEVFEYFNAGRPAATVMEISRCCGYPQSSVSKLLSCLAGLGYLHHDRIARTYRPTARVALLGSWVQPHLFRGGTLVQMIDELAEETGCEVWLGNLVGLNVQILQAVAPDGEAAEGAWPGMNRPLIRSPLGRVLLSAFDPAYARKLVSRLHADTPAELRVPLAMLDAQTTRIRQLGYAVTVPEWDLPEDTGCAMLLPLQTENEDRLALHICAPQAMEQSMDQDKALVRAARDTITRHFSLVAVSAALS